MPYRAFSLWCVLLTDGFFPTVNQNTCHITIYPAYPASQILFH